MTNKLGIWKLTNHHPPHEHTPLRRAPPQPAEVPLLGKKPRPTKYERPVEDDPHPASSEEFALPEEAIEPASSTIAANEQQVRKPVVAFDTVQVRRYEVILGDNPDCVFPLELGWRYTEQAPQALDSYEERALPKRKKPYAEIEHSLHIGQVLASSSNPITPYVHPLSVASDPLRLTCLRPLTLHERRMVLHAQGHSEAHLRKEERQRRVQLALEWAGGHYPKQEACPYSRRFFLNYVL